MSQKSERIGTAGLVIVTHTCNPKRQRYKQADLWKFEASLDYTGVTSQPGLHSETLSQTNQKEKKKEQGRKQTRTEQNRLDL